jgi:uncharacterized radical SAM superfamily Fe-S cluster-containing enzyme
MAVDIYDNYVEQNIDAINYKNFKILINEHNWKYIRWRSSNIALAITNRCNMDCKACYIRNNKGDFGFDEMDFKTIKQILHRIGKNKKILLLGGEPTLRKDLFDVIRLVRLSGNIPILYTNGIKLADSLYVDKIVKSGVKKIYFSLDGLDVNNTVQLRGDSSYHYLKLKALKNLEKVQKIKVWISATVAHNINEEEVKNLLNFALRHNNFIKGFIFVPCTSIGWYQLPTSAQLSSSELIDILFQSTGGIIDYEYFYEFNMLRSNIDVVLNKIGKCFPLYRNSIYLNIKDGRFEQYISVKDLKKINNYLEKKSYFKLLKYVFRYNLWSFVFKALIHSEFTEMASYKRNGLHIMIDEINFPTYDPALLSKVTVTLSEWQNDIFAVITI